MKISWGILGVLLLSLFCSACSNGKAKNPVAPPHVVVGLTAKKAVPVELRAIGNVQAFSTVMVKSKVGGELVRVHFKEGQDVKKGDLLFTVDPRPYEAVLNDQREMGRIG